METSLVEYGLASVLSLILLILTIVWKRSSSSSSLPPSPVPPPSSLPADDPVDQAGPKKGTKNSRRRAARSNSQKNPIPPSPALPPISSPLYRPSVANQEVPSLDLSPSSSSSSSSSYSGSSPLDRAVSSNDQGESSSSSSSSKGETKMTKTDLIIAKYITPYYKPIKFEALAPEIETGNVEYKLKLSPPCDERFEQLVSQMQYRIEEGNGEAIYEIGVEDHGSPHGLLDNDLAFSLDVLTTMATNLGAVINVLRIRDGREGKVAEVLIRKQSKHEQYTEMRVAIIGNVDAGKSTLLGVLSRGALDNGRGKARATVFRHKHEIESGRTSDVSREVLGFDSKGDIVNYSSVRAMSSSEICESSSKVVTFVDLAGHEKYLRTTVFGLTGNCPDYAMCVIASNNGVIGMTKEHYHLTLALKIPCFFVVTKVDICPANILEETLTTLRKMVKAPGSNRIPTILNNEDEVVAAVRNIPTERIAPIFLVSNVNGTNLELLRLFLNLLPSRKDWDALSQQPPLLYVDNIFPMVSGVGIVLSGTLIQGVMSVNQNLMLGPDEFGKFIPVTIKSIHTNRIPVNSASAGHSVSFALKKIKKTSVRKGQVLVDPSLNPQSTWQFEADVFVITHSTTINQDYEAVIHCGCARQTATIRHVDSVLRANSRGRVRFQFKYRPEFIAVGERLIFREGKTKGIGTVVNVLYDTEPPSTHLHPDHKIRPGHPKN